MRGGAGAGASLSSLLSGGIGAPRRAARAEAAESIVPRLGTINPPPPARAGAEGVEGAEEDTNEYETMDSDDGLGGAEGEAEGMNYSEMRIVSGNATVSADDLTVSVGPQQRGFPTVSSAGILLSSGKWYYEALLLTGKCIQVGFIDAAFVGNAEEGDGVGDCTCSWAYDGYRQLKWHDGESACVSRDSRCDCRASTTRALLASHAPFCPLVRSRALASPQVRSKMEGRRHGGRASRPRRALPALLAERRRDWPRFYALRVRPRRLSRSVFISFVCLPSFLFAHILLFAQFFCLLSSFAFQP